MATPSRRNRCGHDKEGISGQNPVSELTKVQTSGDEAREPKSVVSQGSGHSHGEHNSQDKPKVGGHLPGIGQYQGFSMWKTQFLGSTVGQSMRIGCKGFLKSLGSLAP